MPSAELRVRLQPRSSRESVGPERAGVLLTDLYTRTPGKLALLAHLSARYDEAALATAQTPSEDVHDRLFDATMARVDYLRAVSLTHAKEYDAAAEWLAVLLNPETPDYHPKVRSAVLYPAWNLAIQWHPEIEVPCRV